MRNEKLSKADAILVRQTIGDIKRDRKLNEELNLYFDEKYNRNLVNIYEENQIKQENEYWEDIEYDDTNYEDGLDKLEI